MSYCLSFFLGSSLCMFQCYRGYFETLPYKRRLACVIQPSNAFASVVTKERPGFSEACDDPLMMEFPLLKKPLHFHAPNERPPEWLVKYNTVIEKADACVVVSGEYNRCIPPALTNMMDHFPPKTYRGKPCGIVCYSAGPGGGSTAGMQLRYFLGELGMVTPGFMYMIPVVHQAFSEDGTPDPTNDTALSKASRLISELEWYAEALKNQKQKKEMP